MPTNSVSAAAETSLKGKESQQRRALIEESMPDVYPEDGE